MSDFFCSFVNFAIAILISFDSFTEGTVPKPLPRKDVNEGPQPIKENLRILCACSSPCGQYFALADDHKQLTVWKWEDKSLVKQWNILRRANRILFDNDSKSVLVAGEKPTKYHFASEERTIFKLFADKSGDVFKFDLASGNDSEGECILGHFSMLLDLVQSRCGNFLITSDRDEKIRVSHYPNAYNIHNYCLGHTDFVGSISIANLDNVLISASGDGTLRTWDYLKGRELDQAVVPKDAGIEPVSLQEETNENYLRVQRNPWPAVLSVRMAENANDKTTTIAATVEE